MDQLMESEASPDFPKPHLAFLMGHSHRSIEGQIFLFPE
jgi:hypothetical protein